MSKARVTDFLFRPIGVPQPKNYYESLSMPNDLDRLCAMADDAREDSHKAMHENKIDVYKQVLRRRRREDDDEVTRKIAREAVEYARKYCRPHEELYQLMLTYLE